MDSSQIKQKILIVDDTPENIQILMSLLKDEYAIVAAINGQKALQMAVVNPVPDLILLDIMMPGLDGYQVIEKLKEDDKTKNIPVIFVTAMTQEEDEQKGLDLGAVDYIAKPFRPGLVKSRVKNHIELKRHRDHLEELVEERTEELVRTQDATINSLATLAEYRDPETGGHIKRTQNYVKALAVKLKDHPKFSDFFTDETINELFKSAPLHDVGKVGVPDHILMKPGKLTDEEFEEMKKHTTYGYETIFRVELELGGGMERSFMSFAGEIAHTHQEKWDGSGYPQGLKEEDIPISGRLMALADVYDALISRRVYKAPFTHSKAIAIIEEGKGQHFDPDMTDAFLEIHEEIRMIAIEYADHDEEREALAQ
ncbi:two-component system response regulator [Thermodesulfobacteriota bacterium]